MIERQAVDTSTIGVQDTRTVRASDPGTVALRSDYGGAVGDAGWRSRMLQGLGAKLGDAGMAYLEQKQQEAYLEGQAKVGQIQSEDELEGSWLTRDWAVAGYRDTQGKLALAQAEAKLAVDMQELRTKTPAEMQTYLSSRRNELTPMLNSMSRMGRATLSKQLAMADQTAIMKHTAEHRAYIIDSIGNGIQASVKVGMDNLTSARDNAAQHKAKPEDYHKTAAAVVGSFYSNVWENPALKGSPELKQKLTMEFLENALANRHTNVYEMLANKEVDLGLGQKGTVLAALKDGDMVKLSNAYRSAQNDTAAERNISYIAQKAIMEEEMKGGRFSGTWDDVSNFVNTGLVNGVLDKGSAESFIQTYAAQRAKGLDEAALADAAVRGDSQFILGKEKSYKDATDALEKRMMRAGPNGTPLPVPAQVQQLAIAMNNGNPEAAKRIGGRMGVALQQMSRADGTLDPQHMETFNTVLKELEGARDSKVAEMNMLSGMTDEQREKFTIMRTLRESGVAPDVALTRADSEVLANSKLTQSERAGRAAAKAKEYQSELDSLKSYGFFKKMLLNVGAAFGGEESATALRTRPYAPWWGDNQAVGKYEQDLYTATAMSLEKVKIKHPGMAAGDAVQAALADVANRTVPTGHGPLILPEGYDHKKFFGVDAKYPPEIIGKAVDKVLVPAQKGNRFEFDVTPSGILVTERTPDGGVAGRPDMRLDPKSVAKAAAEIADERTKRDGEVHGAGRTVRKDTAAVTYNGENSAAVNDSLMFKFRTNLVNNEGVRDTVYDDLSKQVNKRTGKLIQTVGVGVSDTNPYFPRVRPDGKVDKADIDRSFKLASNDAARTGVKLQQKLGLKDEASFLLFSEFAYQGMGGTFSDMAVALSKRDAEKARAMLKTTKAYQYSGESRKKHYESLVEQILKG